MRVRFWGESSAEIRQTGVFHEKSAPTGRQHRPRHQDRAGRHFGIDLQEPLKIPHLLQ